MNIKEFKKGLPPKKAIMGFDYGSKRLGVAVSDLSLTIASSYTIVTRQDWVRDVENIRKIIKDKEIGAMVLGLPLQMNGEEGEIAVEVRNFAEKLSAATGLSYYLWDERLSSSAMEKFLIKEVDMSRKRRREVLDSSAASYILQGFLDALKRA